MASKLIIATAIGIMFLLIVLSLFGVLSWVVTGVLLPVIIGVVSWILNHPAKAKERTSKAKEGLPERTGQPKQPRMILEETCEVEGEGYVFYTLDLRKGKMVKGKVSSDETINLFFLTKYGFTNFEKNRDFSYGYGGESLLKKKIRFTPSKTGVCYLVIENEGEDPATVDIHLFV